MLRLKVGMCAYVMCLGLGLCTVYTVYGLKQWHESRNLTFVYLFTLVAHWRVATAEILSVNLHFIKLQVLEISLSCSFGENFFFFFASLPKNPRMHRGSGKYKSFGFIYDECADKHHLAETFSVNFVLFFLIHEKLLTLPLGKHPAENA